jgi:hypothetical protein
MWHHADPTDPRRAGTAAQSMSDATEQLMRAYQNAFEAFGDACQDAFAGLAAGPTSAMTSPLEWPCFGGNDQLVQAGKQLSSAYLLAIETYLATMRKMLD